jgi:hypothetical protein
MARIVVVIVFPVATHGVLHEQAMRQLERRLLVKPVTASERGPGSMAFSTARVILHAPR